MEKVVLLGSSNQLVTKPRGDVIDSFDVIWRTNHTGHPHALKSYPELLGSRFGNWYCHDLSYSIFKSQNNKLVSNFDISAINKYDTIIQNIFDVEIEQLKNVGCSFSKGSKVGIYNSCNKKEIFSIQQHKIICSNKLYNSPYNNLYFGYFNWMKDCYKSLNSNGLSLKPPPNQKPSSGLRMLVYLLKHYEHVHLIGFNGGETGHWYTDKNIKLNYDKKSDKITTQYNRYGKKGNKPAKHHLNIEFQFMKLMQKQGKVTIHE